MIRPLSIQDLWFENTILECETNDGLRFQRLVRAGMPKITPNAIKCVFYLYHSVRDARAGVAPQGTGFLVGESGKSPSPFGWRSHLYAVTNWHLAVDDSDKDNPPAPVIRLNRRDGTPHIVPLTPKDWRFIAGLDVAVAHLDLGDEQLDVLCIPAGMFLTPKRTKGLEIGVGEDVFMMGLFVDHHGGPTNVPAARFGNISMMPNPNALLPCEKLPDVEGFVLDVHSRSGFSGSPVFVYRTFGSDLTVPISSHFNVELQYARGRSGASRDLRVADPISAVRLNVEHDTIFELLGIHYAQFHEELESEKAGVIDGLSGMTCAIPAWRILEVLNLQEFVDMRIKRDAEIEKQTKNQPKSEKAKRPKKGKLALEGNREALQEMLKRAVSTKRST